MACAHLSCLPPHPIQFRALPSLGLPEVVARLRALLALRPQAGCFQICLEKKGRKLRASLSERPLPTEVKPHVVAPSSSPVVAGMTGLPGSARPVPCPTPHSTVTSVTWATHEFLSLEGILNIFNKQLARCTAHSQWADTSHTHPQGGGTTWLRPALSSSLRTHILSTHPRFCR